MVERSSCLHWQRGQSLSTWSWVRSRTGFTTCSQSQFEACTWNLHKKPIFISYKSQTHVRTYLSQCFYLVFLLKINRVLKYFKCNKIIFLKYWWKSRRYRYGICQSISKSDEKTRQKPNIWVFSREFVNSKKKSRILEKEIPFSIPVVGSRHWILHLFVSVSGHNLGKRIKVNSSVRTEKESPVHDPFVETGSYLHSSPRANTARMAVPFSLSSLCVAGVGLPMLASVVSNRCFWTIKVT